jgi:hypothetical protein
MRGSPAGIDRHAAVDRGGVEVQQHGLRFRFDHGHRDVVPGEDTYRFGRLPERVGGQLDGAVLAPIPAQQERTVEAGQLAEFGQQRSVEVTAVAFRTRGAAIADQVLTIMSLFCVMRGSCSVS